MSPNLCLQGLLKRQLRMAQTIKPDFLKKRLFRLFYLSFCKPNLLIDRRVQSQWSDFFEHRHSLILLNIASRYRMYHHPLVIKAERLT